MQNWMSQILKQSILALTQKVTLCTEGIRYLYLMWLS